jgi:putative glycosyl hydrolase
MSVTEQLTRRPGPLAAAAVTICALSLATVPGPASARVKHRGSSSQAVRAAAKARTKADHALVRAARRLARCARKHPGHCTRERHALQRAGQRLSRSQRHLRRLARQRRRADRAASVLKAPVLSVSGNTLSWNRVNHVSSYVIERKIPNLAADYTVTSSTSWTPPVVSGATVSYRVRTNVSGSTWSAARSITYPSAPSSGTTTSGTTTTTQTPPPVDLTAAPTLTVSGQSLSWNQIGSVTNYVVVAKSAGQTDRYIQVTGTSVTPPAVAGATVQYSVRTAVDGSAWSLPVSITYPSAVQPVPPPPAPSSPMVVGINGASYGTTGVNDVKNAVNNVRLDSGLSTTNLHNFESAGVKIDLDFSGPYNSSGVSGLNASGWVSNTLSFYEANTNPTQTPYIEVLNEPGGTWFWGSNALSQANADAYRNLLQQTYNAFHAAYGSSAPKILATFDGSAGLTFGKEWWTSAAAGFVDGIVVHPYGGTGDRTSSALGNRQRVADAHAYTGKPIYVTEVGWPTCTSCSPTSDSLQWSETDQATNLTNFIDWARGTGYVAGVWYFNYHDFGTSDWYGVVRSDGSHKPAYDALKAEAQK